MEVLKSDQLKSTPQTFPEKVMHVKSEAEFPEGFELIISEEVDPSHLEPLASMALRNTLLVLVTKSATGGAKMTPQSVVEYAELVGKDNF